MHKIIYQGNVRVYLQGKNALTPIPPGNPSNGHITYYIGEAKTNLILCDHRPETVAEAHQILRTNHQNRFTKHFNQWAKAEIRFDTVTQHMKIELHKLDSESEDCPILWMGILEDNTMPGYKVQWEVFKPLNANQTAFVALIAQTS